MAEFTKEQLINLARENVKVLKQDAMQHKVQPVIAMDLRLAEIALAALTAEHAGWQAKNHAGNWMTIKDEDVHHYRFNEELPTREVYTAPPALTAGMGQEPVAYTCIDALDDVYCGSAAMVGPVGAVGEVPLYAAPQLPQPAVLLVPDERSAFETFMEKRFKDCIDRRLVKNGDGEYFAWDMQVAWITWQGRAAMLQGADCNSPVIPDGWVSCSERMPETMVSVLVTGTWFHHAVAFWDGFSWCDLDFEQPVTHWMPLPAAPQQEVNK